TISRKQGSGASCVQCDPEQCRKLFVRMARMGGMLSTRVRTGLPEALNAAYDEASYVPALGEHFAPPPPPDAVAARAVITEWEVGGTGSMQHDITVHPDGRIYSADTTQDKLYRLDPRTGERRTFDIPRGDSPLGGVFTVMQPIPANADAHVAPHSLQVAPDGSIWITLCLGNKIARFDPRTEQFEIFLQEDGLYPHTLRFDARGRAWYTLAVSNQVAMIDPRSGEPRTYRLPARTWGETVAVRSGPCRTWDLPTEPRGTETPYALNVERRTDTVWICGTQSDTLIRFEPASERFTVYPLPTRVTYTREIEFGPGGAVWTSNSNLPAWQ